MKKPATPSASSRTIDWTGGRTRVEELAIAQEDVTNTSFKGSESIEQAAERWRQNAFFTQEHLSKHYNNGEPGKAVFRLTEKDGWMYLEQFRQGKEGMAYHYTGLMFRKDDLYELAGVLVKASREKQNGTK